MKQITLKYNTLNVRIVHIGIILFFSTELYISAIWTQWCDLITELERCKDKQWILESLFGKCKQLMET